MRERKREREWESEGNISDRGRNEVRLKNILRKFSDMRKCWLWDVIERKFLNRNSMKTTTVTSHASFLSILAPVLPVWIFSQPSELELSLECIYSCFFLTKWHVEKTHISLLSLSFSSHFLFLSLLTSYFSVLVFFHQEIQVFSFRIILLSLSSFLVLELQ